MFNILYIFNLFPYVHLWRINKGHHHSNKCSIIISILIIIAISAVFLQRLAIIFKKQTMMSSLQSVISPSPPPTTISTYQNDEENQPFMFAVDYVYDNPNLNINSSNFNISVFVNALEGPTISNRTRTNHTINLETCTPQHFAMFDDISIKFNRWGASNWLCLPLNQRYTIEGSYSFDTKFTRISLLFNCSGACMNNFTGMNVRLYTVSAVVNPTNSTRPQQHFLEEMTIPIYQNQYREYSYSLKGNQIEQDNSLWPWQKISHHHSLQTDKIRYVQHNSSTPDSSSLIYYHRSSRTNFYTSRFLKLLDAVAFVGGIFQAVLGVFVFMVAFGRIFYQFKFGRRFFNDQNVKDFSFTDFVKQMSYKFLKFFNCQPSWKKQTEREHLQETVNHMLDIVYLQRRIDILERALPILLQEHQIKGLYLMHTKTRKEMDSIYQKHQLRERVINYLVDQEGIQKDPELSQELKEIQMMNKEKMGEKDEKYQDFEGQESQFNEVPNKVKRESSERLDPMEMNDIVTEAKNEEGQVQNEGSYRFYIEMLRNAVNQLGSMSFSPISEEEMKREISPDILRLCREAEVAKDERSKKIYDSIQEWIREIVKKEAKKRERGQQKSEKKGMSEVYEFE